MLYKLKKLPENTQQVLRLAACIGTEFNLDTLSIVCEKPHETVFQDLLTAIQFGLIQPLSQLDENLLIQEYKFLHDRVQQASYTLIDDSKKQIVHLQIGRNLFEKTLPERLLDRLFEIVNHLNHGIELVTDKAERNEVARLNLIAGQKAKGAIAYSMAKTYLDAGRAWLGVSSWQTNYDLTLELYVEKIKAAFLNSEFEQVNYWAETVLQQANSIFDTVKVYEVKIQTEIAQNQRLKAVNTGLQVLQQLGISFSEEPTQFDIQRELDAITSYIRETPIEDLVHLPEMTNPDKLAAMRILSSITIAAHNATPDLMPLLVSKQVSLSIQYGNAFVSPFAYATYGFILCKEVGDIEAGYEFGQLALKLLSQSKTHSERAGTLLFINHFINHWKEHTRESLELLLEAYQSGLETGNLEAAAYCAYTYCFQLYVSGKELVEVERKTATYSEAIRQIKQEAPLIWSQIFHQAVLNLMGCSINPTRLIGESYNEENSSPQTEAANSGIAATVYFHKFVLCYLFSEYAQAVENLVLAESYLFLGTGSLGEPPYYFYDSLVRLAIYPRSSTQAKEEILGKVALSQEKMKRWAHYAPMNCLHKYHLVEAEKAQVLGKLLEAEKFYEQAIQGARENEYIQEEALAYELAAKHYLARGLEKFAQFYMKEAHYCYERWGAMAKVKDLETRYPQLFSQSSNVVSTPVRTTTETSSNTPHTALDLATVMKAAQAISSEIELEQLLSSLMQILIENAGAQTGCLLLENAGEWRIDAACELVEGESVCTARVLQSTPIANRLPESIIHYVIRTYESVILNDATREGNFINDPYIQHHQTQSVFCLPLLNQSKLIGVLYLENQLATGAFTPEQSQLLNLLSTQAAIAIENAKLYSKLRASESRMAQFLEAVPVGISIVDAVGRVHYVNQRGVELMGKGIDPTATPDQISEVYQCYVMGTDQIYPTQRLPVVRALSGERTTVDDLEIHQNNKTIPVEVWGTPVFDEQGNVAYAIAAFQDITERKQAEKLLADYHQTLEQRVTERTLLLSQEIEERQRVGNALRQSEEQRRLTMDFTYIGSWNWNIVENTTHWNNNHARLLGLVPGEVESSYQAWRDRVHPEDIHRVEQAVTAALATHTDFEAEYRVIYPNGNIHWLVGRGRGIYNAVGQPVRMLGVILDISDQKRAEEASILEERNRMAREIHDTLAQSFTGVIIHARTAANKITVDPQKAQAHLAQVQNLAQTGLSEARRSVEALRRPYLLENSDLLSAFKHLTSQLESSTGITIMCEAIGIPYLLPSEVENNLLRIGQEALTNALKYAQATEIRVELIYQSTQCILRIKDDGQGFAIDRDSSHNGFGLLGMVERADLIRAKIQIQSALGQGTEIAVSVNQQEKLS
ncbi:PAS domain-containing protein [Nostoc flagelliforme]|uniref:PAS domain-containing protein n=1 Tax=Nostoc flagelliforme TaxID=1306274 RepID=UPI001F556B32|nr:PAS domain-containing protein [Nostoc flagelliforme]